MPKISELPAGTAATGAEKIPAVQSGVTVELTTDQAVPRSIVPTWTGLHTFTATAGGIAVNGTPNISLTPVGQGATNIGALVQTLTAGSNTTQEMGAIFTIDSSTGFPSGGTAAKVGVYGAARARAGSTWVYGGNFLAELAAGASAGIQALGAEFNIANLRSNSPAIPAIGTGSFGLAVAGLGTASGAFLNTAAMWVTTATGPTFYQGLSFTGGTNTATSVIVNETIYDGSYADTSYKIAGGHTYGIDTKSGTFSGVPIRLGNLTSIAWRNAADSSDQAVLTLDSNNNVLYGASGYAGSHFLYGATVAPATDNATALGGATVRWTTAHAMGLKLYGATSGNVNQVAQATAGTPTITWGNASGTPAISVPSPLSLSTTTGAVSWSGLTSGGVLYASSTTSVASSALLATNALVKGGGAGAAPSTTGYTIDANNGLSINQNTAFGPAWSVTNSANDATSPLWQFNKTRGGSASQVGDNLFWIQMSGADAGNTVREAADYQIQVAAVGTGAATVQAFHFWSTANGSAVAERMRLSAAGGLSVGTTTDPGAGAVLANASIKSQSATAGIGYATGAGGDAGTQATSKSTGVTINKVTGKITMNAAALAAGAKVAFTVTNSTVAATDVPVVAVASGGTANAYRAEVVAVAAGSFAIAVENITAGSLSESPVISFALLKGVIS